MSSVEEKKSPSTDQVGTAGTKQEKGKAKDRGKKKKKDTTSLPLSGIAEETKDEPKAKESPQPAKQTGGADAPQTASTPVMPPPPPPVAVPATIVATPPPLQLGITASPPLQTVATSPSGEVINQDRVKPIGTVHPIPEGNAAPGAPRNMTFAESDNKGQSFRALAPTTPPPVIASERKILPAAFDAPGSRAVGERLLPSKGWVVGEAKLPQYRTFKLPRGKGHYIYPDANNGVNRAYILEPLPSNVVISRELDLDAIEIFHKFACPVTFKYPKPGPRVDIYSEGTIQHNSAFEMIARDPSQQTARRLMDFKAADVQALPVYNVNGLAGFGGAPLIGGPIAGEAVPLFTNPEVIPMIVTGVALLDSLYLTPNEATADALAWFNTSAIFSAAPDEAKLVDGVLIEQRPRVSLPYWPLPLPDARGVRPQRPRIRSYRALATTYKELRVYSQQQASGADFGTSPVEAREAENLENRFRTHAKKYSAGTRDAGKTFAAKKVVAFAGGIHGRVRIIVDTSTPSFVTTLVAGLALNEFPRAFLVDDGHDVFKALLEGLGIRPIPQNLVNVMTNPVLRNGWAVGNPLKQSVAAFLNRVLNPARWVGYAVRDDPFDRPPVMLPAGFVAQIEVPGRVLDGAELARVAAEQIAVDFYDAICAPNGSLAHIFNTRWNTAREVLLPNSAYTASHVHLSMATAYAYRYGLCLPMTAGAQAISTFDFTANELMSWMVYGIGVAYRHADVGNTVVPAEQVPIEAPPNYVARIASIDDSFLKIDILWDLIAKLVIALPRLAVDTHELASLVYRIFNQRISDCQGPRFDDILTHSLALFRRGVLPATHGDFIDERLDAWAVNGGAPYSYVYSDSFFYHDAFLFAAPAGGEIRRPLPPRQWIRLTEAVMRHYGEGSLDWLLHRIPTTLLLPLHRGTMAAWLPLRIMARTFWDVSVIAEEDDPDLEPVGSITATSEPVAGLVAPKPLVGGLIPQPNTISFAKWKRRFRLEAAKATLYIQSADDRPNTQVFRIAAPEAPFCRVFVDVHNVGPGGAVVPTTGFSVATRSTQFANLIPRNLLALFAVRHVVVTYTEAEVISIDRAAGIV